MNQAVWPAAAGGGRENVERAPPRDWPRIRNFLACVFLPQVKWIVPISSVRGQLHYVKETLTLNVMECRTLAQRVKHPAGEASLTITIHDHHLLSGAKEAGIMMHSLLDRPRHRALFSPTGWVVKETSCSHISGLKIEFGPCTHPLCSDMSLLSPCFLSVYTGIWIRNKDPALRRSEILFFFLDMSMTRFHQEKLSQISVTLSPCFSHLQYRRLYLARNVNCLVFCGRCAKG